MYSDEALAFSKIPVSHQVRMEDRVSYLYLEYTRIIQDNTGVVAVSEKEDGEMCAQRIELPVAGIAVIFLGPGTSITQPAAASCARAGTTIVFSGGGGVPCYTAATPLTSSSRWLIAQAKLSANQAAARRAARVLYSRQLGIDMPEDIPISRMRGIEGQKVKLCYRQQAKKHGISGFKRDVKATDPVNINLNILNGILYGCAASACAALGVSAGLGIIHRGDARALLFDLADMYKPMVTIPIAFGTADAADPAEQSRRQLRKYLHQEKVLEEMIQTLIEVLTPHLPEIADDRLVNDRGEVEGHRLYI